MRVSMVLSLLPRQYAPATDSRPTAPIRPVSGTCGPRQRSRKSPCL